MLTGQLPCEGSEEDSEDSGFCFGDTEVDLDIPEYLTNSCADLLGGMLEEDPYRRLTLKEVQRHAWTKSWEGQSKE